MFFFSFRFRYVRSEFFVVVFLSLVQAIFVLSGVFFIATMSFAAMAVFLSTIIASVSSKGKHRRAIPAWLSQVLRTNFNLWDWLVWVDRI